MFPLSPADLYVAESRRQDLVRSAATARLLASHGIGARPGAVAGVLRGIASALGRATALLPDGREGIRSKEQDLAALGVTWVTDPVRDHALALDLQAARARRQAHWLASPAGEVLEALGSGRRASGPRIRRALDVALAR
jgi:hypothetical protein